ncbi:unnamed protein product [Tilletia controversa]|nr:unnamed protein product [Tilletia controversa]
MPPTRNSLHCRIPRRHLPTTPTPSPPKDRTEVERSVVADRLVDSSVAIISSIWFSPLPTSGNATPPSSQSSLCPLPSTSNDNINDAPSPTPSSSSSSSSEEYDIFSQSQTQKNCTAAPQLPLRLFIRESLRRSRTSCSTLQAALLYCVRAQRAVMAARLEGEGRYDDAVRLAEDDAEDGDGEGLEKNEGCSFDRERGYVLADSSAAFAALANITSLSTPLPQENEADPIRSSSATTRMTTDLLTPPPSSPKRQERELNAPIRFSLSPAPSTTSSKKKEKEKEKENSILLCGRRMFLASVMVASKFLQDHNYSYHAWSRISGLPVSELGVMERSFLRAVGYDLVVRRGGEGWAEWVVELEGRAERERVRVQGEVMREVLDLEESDSDSDSDMGDDDEGKEKRVAGGAKVVAGATDALALAMSHGQKGLLRPKGTAVLARPPLPSGRTSSSSSSSYSSSSSASSLRYTPYGTGPAVAKMASHGYGPPPPSSSSAPMAGSYHHHYFSHHGSSSSSAAFQLPLSALSSW